MVVWLLLALALAPGSGQSASETIEGRLLVGDGSASLATARGMVALEGDEETRKVLHDKRLAGVEMKARGHFVDKGRFAVDPIHTRALLVRKDGRLKLITYWCAICSIRAYAPGECWCCQEETTLDLRDPDDQ